MHGMRRLALPALACALAAAAERPPNLVLIIADDMGYADAGFQGATDVRTPHLDRIAAEGVRCTQAYVAGAVCSPSRAGLMSGRWPQRFGHEYNPVESDPQVGIDRGERTLAERLAERGYDTALFGKWHLGFGQPFHPRTRGFAAFAGMWGGGHDYFLTQANQPRWSYRGLLEEDGQPASLPADGYITDWLSERAAAWIRSRDPARPFCLVITYNAPHSPLQAPPRWREAMAHIPDNTRRVYAAMLGALDEGVGRIDAALAETGAAARTLTIFHSDNGGPIDNGASNAPLRGHKGQFTEGGVRVPMLWRLPGVLPAGAVRQQPVITLDIAATMAALAGPTSGPPLDGVDVLPALAGDTPLPERSFFWRWDQRGAVRQGAWKLLIWPDQPMALYDLEHDPSEAQDLAQARPERVAALRATWNAWSAQMRPPAFAPLVVRKPKPKP
jgi:arylsulfatase A-like enzyme